MLARSTRKKLRSGKARTVALPAMAVEELRRWRAAHAEELLRLGVPWTAELRVVTQADDSRLQPQSVTLVVPDFLRGTSPCTAYGTDTPATCWHPTFTPRWCRNGSDIRPSRSRWI